MKTKMSRAAITHYSLLLLAERFPWGLGWSGLQSQSIGVIPYTTDQRARYTSARICTIRYMIRVLEGRPPIPLLDGTTFGAFQQRHMRDTFGQLFGFALGCYLRSRSDDEVDDSAFGSNA